MTTKCSQSNQSDCGQGVNAEKADELMSKPNRKFLEKENNGVKCDKGGREGARSNLQRLIATANGSKRSKLWNLI